MMPAPATPFAVPTTLGALNARLSELGLPRLSVGALQQLLQSEPRERLLQALARANADSGARAYLERVVKTLSSPSASETVPAPANEDRVSALPPAEPPPPTPPARVDSQERSERCSVHVYGAKGALCWEADVTRNGQPTVMLEAAAAKGVRQYDWSAKLRLQFTRHELVVVLSVLLGFIARCEFKNHGESNNKGFSIEDQGSKFFVRVFGGDQGLRAVPMEPEDAFQVAALLIRQLCAASPWLSGAEVVTLARAIVGRMKKVQLSKEKGD